jgi:hypothetical protein
MPLRRVFRRILYYGRKCDTCGKGGQKIEDQKSLLFSRYKEDDESGYFLLNHSEDRDISLRTLRALIGDEDSFAILAVPANPRVSASCSFHPAIRVIKSGPRVKFKPIRHAAVARTESLPTAPLPLFGPTFGTLKELARRSSLGLVVSHCYTIIMANGA